MLGKRKLLFLTILINCFLAKNALALSKFNTELYVSGEDVRERVDYALSSKPKDVDSYLDNGDISDKHSAWVENGATLHNIGTIYTKRENIDSQCGGILIGGVNNVLKRQDDLIVLRGKTDGSGKKSTFINDGLVDMGIIYHKMDVVLSVLDLVFYKDFAIYTKNVINSENSDIINNGTIQSQGDKIYYRTDVQVGLLQYNSASYEKNVILMNRGSLENTGIIQYDRDRNAEVVGIVGVELLNLGLHYNREKTAINATNAEIINKMGGEIFVGGDLLEDRDYNGINVNLIGADFVGKHHKYGIKADGGVVKNFGTIEVERDFSKALDHNNNILDLYLIYSGILELGLLSFDSMNEKSVGVSITNGTFYNNGGTISVGANNKKVLEILDSSAIAVEANGSNIYFNTDEAGNNTNKKSVINLEGQNVYATFLSGNSSVIFDGITEINYVLPKGLKEEDKAKYIENINKEIFHRKDGTGTHTVKGLLKVNGDLKITDASEVKIADGGKIEADNPPWNNKLWGKIASTGTINLAGNIKIDTKNLIGLSEKELEEYKNHVVITADKGITGNGNLVSDSYIFSVESDKSEGKNLQNNLSITDIKRKNFNSIVANKELGNILENSYENMSEKEKEFYKYIASGSTSSEFSKKLDEAAGTDNITTLQTQIMDITKDLNRQYRGFAENNEADGVVFSYLNSKSEAGSEGKYQGFERKSSGIMTAYNKNISDKLRTGAGFSYMASDIDYTSNSSNKIETWNARGYFDYGFKNINLLTDLSFSYNKSENKRQISGTLNEGTADIYTLGLNNSLYGNYKINEKFSFSPSINLDFTYYYQDDYQEGENTLAVEAEKTDGMYMTLGAGAEFKYDLFSFGKNKFSLVGGLEYSYDILSENEDMEIELTAFKDGKFSEEIRKIDKEFLIYDLGISYEYGETYSVDIKYSKELINDVENEKIGLDFSYKF